MQDQKEKKCWACKRILVGKSKLGLCPCCIDKTEKLITGAGITALGVIGLGVKGKGKK